MTTVVPLGALESGADALGVFSYGKITLVVDPDVGISASSGEVLSSWGEVNTMNWIVIFLDGEEFLHWRDMPVLKIAFTKLHK